MISIDASEIARWATRPEASQQLPTLVRRLILATVPTASLLDMPDGSSVYLYGWDGKLTVPHGNPWVPSETSAWEFSTQANPTRKANEDYEKRTKDPLSIDASNATFVFLTPRRWPAKQKWETARRNEHRWADVKALDARDLAAWLEQAPAVAAWFARLTGQLPADGYIPLDEWWERWALAAQPSITPDLVVAGRTQATGELAKWAQAPASSYYLQAHTKDEAIAFLAASALSANGEWGGALIAKSLVVESTDAWRSLEQHQQPLTLIRNFNEGITPLMAVRQGHHVLTPLYAAEDPKGNGATLTTAGREETVQALIQMGISKRSARRLAYQTGRRLPIIRRQLIEEAGGQTPEWASPAAYPWLPGLALFGQWDENNPADLDLITKFIGKPYDDIASGVVALMLTPESPLTKVGNLIKFICHEEAWYLLAPFLTSSQMTRFEAVAIETLGQKSPKFDMAIDKRHLANVYGRTLAHSDILREGIARSLALVGIHPKRAKNAADSAHLATSVVATILNDAEWQIWATLSRLLPILAEAAPEAFLSAVEIALAAKPSPFVDLFAQESGNLLFGGSPHTGLLWALEVLAWSRDHFSRTTICLTHLAAIDPGGKVSNRPMNSLAALFQPWIRFSEAPDYTRLEMLNTLLDQHPATAWRVLAKVHPKIHGSVVSDRHSPDWRPWGADGVQRTTLDEFHDFVATLERLLLEHVGQIAERWIKLLDILPSLSDESRQLCGCKLTQEIAALRAQPIANDLWGKLRSVLHYHRSYPNTDWALSPEELQPIADAYHALTPTDPAIAYAWLFCGWPSLPEGTQDTVHTDAQRGRTAALQQNTIRQVLDSNGVNAVVSIAEASDEPGLVGRALVMLNENATAFDLALKHSGSESPKLRSLVFGIIAATYEKFGWVAIEETIRRFKVAGVSPPALANLYLGTLGGQPTWDRLDNESAEVQTAYWNAIPHYWVRPNTPEDAAYAIRKLVGSNRSYVAATALFCKDAPTASIVEVLASLPHDLNTTALSNEVVHILQFSVLELFKVLDRAQDVGNEVVAELEIRLLGLIGTQRGHLALHRQVCRQPEFFADLVSLAFKPADVRIEQDTNGPVARHLATLACDILSNLHGCPGQHPDGEIDSESLAHWVSETQRLCKERDREYAGNQRIGELLANAPAGTDGIWPCEPVRELLEQLKNRHVAASMVIATYHLRATTIRGLLDGGDQERTLAAKYRSDAETITARWPYTAQILREIASDYEREATWQDQDSARIDEFER